MRAIDADALQLAIVEEGQANKRKKYSIGDIWELTGAEIRDVINSQPTIQPDNNSENPNGSDVISRQAAIDALGELATFTEDWSCYTWMYTDDVYNAIKQLPTIQPEIVRCKDCKYWHSGSCEYPEHVVNSQDYYVGDIETEAEHFCGYAERREVTT